MNKNWPADEVTRKPIGELNPYAGNARTHSDKQIDQIVASMNEWGWTNPVLIDEEGMIIAGHGRVMAATKMGLGEVPVMIAKGWSDAQKSAYVLADNQLALNAGWDEVALAGEFKALKNWGFDTALTGFDDFTGKTVQKDMGSLARRFGIPPFSVFNAREGWWQDRKRAWLSLGLKSDEGREKDLLKFSSACTETQPGSSIFDPVICEIAYRWFCPKGGVVLDPFAGGSVRGVVAATLGLEYHGVDLRSEQVSSNNTQWKEISPAIKKAKISKKIGRPKWYAGDSLKIVPDLDLQADFLFSCPPYGDLEVYSDDPADISNMDADGFDQAYADIIGEACEKLKDDRFAFWVVGEYRNKSGNYQNIVGKTVAAFEAAGVNYCGEAVLITAIGTLPIRAPLAFNVSRKLGKTHQNVLIFIKGDQKKATKAMGEVEFGEMVEVG